MWFVYALYNQTTGKIYVGQTTDIVRRLSEHNEKKGNHFTAHINGEWKVIYKEERKSRSKAIVREKQLKSYQGRQFIKKLISN